MNRRKLTIAVIVGLFVGLPVAFLGHLLFFVYFGNWGAPRHPDLAFVSRVSHVTFPLGAKLLDSDMDKGFQGGTLWARVEMDSAALDMLLKSLPSVVAKSRNRRLDELSSDCFKDLGRPDWWDPDSARHFVDVLLARYPLCGIVVALDDPKKAIIYLVWSG
jgi:hypothetical protein